MINAMEIDRAVDLSLFSDFLRYSGLWHSISETGDTQVIWVRDEAVKKEVVVLYRRYLRGEFSFESEPVAAVSPVSGVLVQNLLRSPLTLMLVLVNVICFPITSGSDTGNFRRSHRRPRHQVLRAANDPQASLVARPESLSSADSLC